MEEKRKKKEIKEKRKSLDSRAQGTKTSCFPFYREERKRRSEKRDSSVYTAGQWIKEYAGPRLWALIERHVLAMMVLVLRGRPWQRRSVSFGRPGCLPLNEFGANLPIFERFEVDIDELKNLAELPPSIDNRLSMRGFTVKIARNSIRRETESEVFSIPPLWEYKFF